MIQYYSEIKERKSMENSIVFGKTLYPNYFPNEMKCFNTNIIPECEFGKTLNVRDVIASIKKHQSKPRFKI